MTLQIAERWFERRRVDDDITLLWEPHVVPLMRCNIWHVRGRDRDLFVDTGMGVASLKEAARDLLDKPVTAVATHSRVMSSSIRRRSNQRSAIRRVIRLLLFVPRNARSMIGICSDTTYCRTVTYD